MKWNVFTELDGTAALVNIAVRAMYLIFPEIKWQSYDPQYLIAS